MRSKAYYLLTLISLILLLTACAEKATPTPAATATQPPPTVTPTAALPTPTATVEEPTPEPTATPKPTPTPIAYTPAFESAGCPFQLPADQVEGETVECGYLTVPENRADPNRREIRLAVAIFHPSGGATEPDPIVYLSGGPGGSALEFLYVAFQQLSPLLAANRDLVLFDQRGVGLSEPALDCPELYELSRELMDYELEGQKLTNDQVFALMVDALMACKEDLAADADLSAYNTVTNAADVNDLRIALGYDQVNLWGTSYGTRLALGVMRDYPEGVRSVILDSVYPPDVNLYLDAPANVNRAINTLFDGCVADQACNAAYPDLRTVFFDTVDRLNEKPLDVEITDALTRERYDAILTGDDLLGFLFSFLYHTDIIPSLPQIIYDASEGNVDMIALIAGSLLAQQEVMSHGMQFSVQCHDEIAFSTMEELEKAIAEYPELTPIFEYSIVGKLSFEVCAFWDAGTADAIEDAPVTSDIPTLVMSGEYDPITPPTWGQRVAEGLKSGYFSKYPGVGHGASVVEGCPIDMMVAFLGDPTVAPDGACIAEMGLPQFVVPGVSEAVEMEPFSNELFGISGVVPVGWTEAGPGVHSRGSSGLDVAVLVQQAAPMSAQDLLALLARQLNLDEIPESIGEREANDLTWSLYFLEVQGLHVDMALAESKELALIVMMQSRPDEHDVLYEAVFLPAVDALTPIP